jgi:hypothetical protein
LKPIIAEIIIPEINSLSTSELRAMTKTLAPLLIEMTICESAEIRGANKFLLQRIFQDLQSRAAR